MNTANQVHHLKKLSKQLVAAAEKRAGLKAELSSLEASGRAGEPTRRRARLERQVQRLSRKINNLIAAITEPAARRVERWAGVMPVTLLVESDGRTYEQPASTVDLSQRGLRIRTTAALSQGQALEVTRGGKRVGLCRVVWVSPGGFERPSEVGLEILY